MGTKHTNLKVFGYVYIQLGRQMKEKTCKNKYKGLAFLSRKYMIIQSTFKVINKDDVHPKYK